MLKIIVKSILIIVIMLLILAIIISVVYENSSSRINKEIDACYDKNNKKLTENLTKMEKGKVDKKGVCQLWKESIEQQDTCFKSVFKIPYFHFLPVEPVKNLQELKEKQNKTCKEYPETMVKQETLKNLKFDIGNWKFTP